MASKSNCTLDSSPFPFFASSSFMLSCKTPMAAIISSSWLSFFQTPLSFDPSWWSTRLGISLHRLALYPFSYSPSWFCSASPLLFPLSTLISLFTPFYLGMFPAISLLYPPFIPFSASPHQHYPSLFPHNATNVYTHCLFQTIPSDLFSNLFRTLSPKAYLHTFTRTPLTKGSLPISTTPPP
ncbi:hypothetical protein C7212DRAFT_312802 [Tuber magnatum]|uniref:Uncharacterized protein n=1 Tax=Tuber magnatum TaxID=42249 RepID=A0A317SUA4_9PEZI|nr:hypothetical protein C7212DRAFT_312802 [Tuber magnatum]